MLEPVFGCTFLILQQFWSKLFATYATFKVSKRPKKSLHYAIVMTQIWLIDPYSPMPLLPEGLGGEAGELRKKTFSVLANYVSSWLA